MNKFTHQKMAELVARDIPEGAYVNLGIGLPTLVGNALPTDREIILHSENGVIGMGANAPEALADPDLINAGNVPVLLIDGGSFMHHADSFALIRGGHLDICVLGAFQVSVRGDLANWHTGDPGAIPSVGGAMDLAVGAGKLFVMMEHLTKNGLSKIVQRCSYPVTALACVDRVYTDLAVLDVENGSLIVREMVEGMTHRDLEQVTGVPLGRMYSRPGSGGFVSKGKEPSSW